MPSLNIASPFEGDNAHVFSRGDFDTISKLIYRESGNVLPPGKAMLVYSRLARRLRERNLATFSDYIGLIRQDDDERRVAVALLTTNHTYFFREDHHFDHFRDHVRDGLIERAKAGETVRFWSAGCSSGEEVYSLAFTLLGPDRNAGLQLAQKPFAFLASDLTESVLETGKAALYPQSALDPVPSALRNSWTKPIGTNVQIADQVRNLVRFRRLNLLGEWPFTRDFQVIFCRNVMIYFDEPTKEGLVERLAACLEPGGHLYIGHSERLPGSSHRHFDMVGKTIYRKRDA
ncbi:protein-glutamate O-methyltransferase CheR [Chakrabartia godavariana]|nr:protein-glutamate O-methyltransferase CheR [Chakrabartia godavariana]